MFDFKEEINVMKMIGYHKNIVNLIGCSTVQQPNCLVVEFMEGGDLLRYLRERRRNVCTLSSQYFCLFVCLWNFWFSGLSQFNNFLLKDKMSFQEFVSCRDPYSLNYLFVYKKNLCNLYK